MTRGLVVRLVAYIYLAQALWAIGSFFFRLDLSSILVGALELWAAIYLLQLSEFGRKYTMVLSALQVIYNLVLVTWAARPGSWAIAIYFLSRRIYESSSVYAYIGMVMVWSSIPLAILVFLGQPATKDLFKSDAAPNRSAP